MEGAVGPTRSSWLGGAAAAIGGLCYVVKGGVILATGHQPPVLFEIAPIFLAVGLRALYLRLRDAGRGEGIAGPLTASVLGAATIATVGGLATREDTVTVGVALALCSLGLVVGLVVLGRTARHLPELPRVRRVVPFALGLATIPLIMVGGALESLGERLLEIPLILIGVGWTAVGWLVVAPSRHPDGTSRVRASPTV
ncbi:MAG TPA: hypothetical protein VNA12_04195 [Mycobacteriales bacterium]|nr:hypothetical protein [Mycobacteriales bacterium]